MRTRSHLSGLTLVETCLVISIIAFGLAAFVPAFYQRINSSKLAEAPTQLAALRRGTAAYYEASHTTPRGPARACLPAEAGPTPAAVGGTAQLVDWRAEDLPGLETWAALDFAPDRPTRFRYTFMPGRSRCGYRPPSDEAAVVLRAEADLDDDGELSRYELRLAHDGAGGLVPLGGLEVRDRVE